MVNGSIISRDEAIIFDNWVQMNYDYRARESGDDYIDIDLPRAARMDHLVWFDGSFATLERRGELARLDLMVPVD